jgi:DNA-binding transcriptional LysR family regulator
VNIIIKKIYGSVVAISLRKLEIFVRVAETEHVTRASEALMVSQSAVSMALAELEKDARGSLFQRKGRRLILNERGRNLLPEARAIIQQVNNFERLLHDSASEPVGEITIGASTTIGNYLLPSIMAEFSRLYPRAKALLQVGNTQQIEAALENGELEIGLIEGPSHATTLEILPWRDDELVVIVGTNHPWIQHKFIDTHMLKNADWIIREKGSGTREVFEEAIKGHLDPIVPHLELGHTEAIKKAVEAGLGVGCLSRLAVQRELDHGWLVELESPLELYRPLTILLTGNSYRGQLSQACLDLLGEYGGAG